MRKKTYLGLTTINAEQNGYTCLAFGSDKDKVKAKCREIIGDLNPNLQSNGTKATEHQNLVVVSKTKAKRYYNVDIDNNEQFVTIQSNSIFVR